MWLLVRLSSTLKDCMKAQSLQGKERIPMVVTLIRRLCRGRDTSKNGPAEACSPRLSSEPELKQALNAWTGWLEIAARRHPSANRSHDLRHLDPVTQFSLLRLRRCPEISNNHIRRNFIAELRWKSRRIFSAPSGSIFCSCSLTLADRQLRRSRIAMTRPGHR